MLQRVQPVAVVVLLLFLLVMAGGAALRESPAVDEVAHVGAGLSYLQRLDLRLNFEHPPLAKALAAVPLVLSGVRADYSSPAWTVSQDLGSEYGAQWAFGDAVLGRWNAWRPVLLRARAPMLGLTLVLGWLMYAIGRRIGGDWGGLLCLALYVTTPCVLTFGPLVITDLPLTLFFVAALWRMGALWADPSKKNSIWFALTLAGALLSKFTGLVLFPVMLVFLLYTRFRPGVDEPVDPAERKVWRKLRRRALWLGVFEAWVICYAVYLVLSLHEPLGWLSFLKGSWALLRRPLLPILLYTIGIAFTLIGGSRATYLFGHVLPHGVPYYFPVVFLVKSTLGFLLLLVFAAGLWAVLRKTRVKWVPDDEQPHWRLLVIALLLFSGMCVLSRLDISVRHLMVPIVLLILLLAPVPRVIAALPSGKRAAQGLVVGLVSSGFIAVIVAYPYFLPFENSLAFGRPVYALVNDSNVSWNEALPEVAQFVREQHLNAIDLDYAALSDPALVVPEARPWDCQDPGPKDTGQWVAVEAVSILENHDCGYLLQYPHKALAGGSFYVFQLPQVLPAEGSPGGPPAVAKRRLPWGVPVDLPGWSLEVERHPERLAELTAELKARFQGKQSAKADAK
jgi:4-amino-4-deoxy-L-arabinose transferase-like glycosyltransferase